MDSGNNGGVKVLQWNVRSINTAKDYLVQYLKDNDFDLLLLQSLNCKIKDLPVLNGFCYPPTYDCINNRVSVATYISRTLSTNTKKFSPTANGAFTWVQVQRERGVINVLNGYFPKQDKEGQWVNKVEKEGGSWLIAGDFNSHSILWEDDCTEEQSGLRDEIVNSSLVILNDGSPTRVPDRADQRMTAVDLTLATPDVAGEALWGVEDNPFSSDHFPLTTSINLNVNKEEVTPPPRYCYDKADWEKFRRILDNSEIPDGLSVEELNKTVTDNILSAATLAIPLGGGRTNSKGNSWWNSECREAVKNKRKALKKYSKCMCGVHHKAWVEAKQECKKIVAQAKIAEWKKFVYELQDRENLTEVYTKIKGMKGQYVSSNTKLVDGDEEYITSLSKANKLADIFCKASSFEGLTNEAKERRLKEEEVTFVDPPPNNDLDINQDICMSELERALTGIKNVKVSEGPDRLSYRMLKEIPASYKKQVLILFQTCWKKGEMPSSWKTAVVSPIPKAGKSKRDPKNYRPIALTSHLGKIYERIVKDRLNHYCESKGIIPLCQAGFRKGRGVSDHLAKLSSHVRRARARRRMLFTCFFDVRRAYDTVWHRKLKQKLKKIGLSGNIYNFVKSFLSNRTFRVRWGHALSDSKRMEMGVPQGSVIAPLLFNLVMGDIDKSKVDGCTLLVYADDVAVVFETNMARIRNIDSNPRYTRCMGIFQNQINKVNQFMQNQGFTLEPTKTQFLIIKAKPKSQLHKDIFITVAGIRVNPGSQARYLGVTFSSSGSWLRHIDNTVQAAQRAVNLIKQLSGTPWASNPKTMVQLTQSLVRSRLIYGFEAFFDAPQHLLKRLEVIECRALKISLGVPNFTPNYLVYRDAGLLPLEEEIRRRSANYSFRCGTVPNSTSQQDLDCPTDTWTQTKVISATEFTAELVVEAGLQGERVAEKPLYPRPPWAMQYQNILPGLNDLKKNENPLYLKTVAYEMIDSQYSEHSHIFTDGSAGLDGVGAAFVVPAHKYSKRFQLPQVSIFTAELSAVLMALFYIRSKSHIDKWCIFSDSKSVLEALQKDGASSREDYVKATLCLLSDLRKRGTEVTLQWIPAHVGIRGNEEADAEAKKGARGEGSVSLDLALSYSDIACRIKRQAWKKRERDFRKVAAERQPLDPTLPSKKGIFFPDQPLAVAHAMHRLRNNAWRGRFLNLNCGCGAPLSPQHVMFDCPRYADHFSPLMELVGREGDMRGVVCNYNVLKVAVTLLLKTDIAYRF